MGNEAVVLKADLVELIYHFDRLDHEARARYKPNGLKINGWEKEGAMCQICGQKESLTICEGCNKYSCEDHYTQALCDSCMTKVAEELERGERIC